MNKKIFLASLLILAVASVAVWFFLKKEKIQPVDTTPMVDGACLVFQSEDSNKPCFFASRPSLPQTSPSPVESACPQASLFEKNDCITRLAEETGDEGLCSSVEGALARASCLRGTSDARVETLVPPARSAYESFVRSYGAQSVSSPPFFSPVSSSDGLSSFQTSLSDEEIAKTSVEGFYQRSANEAPLTLYSVQPYQNKPGSLARLQGWGFALDATNVVHIGGTTVSGLASEDGITLAFTVPAVSSGTYAVSVSNARGSSQVSERPIYMVISNNPVAAPRIISVSPENPSYGDVITLSGENLGGLKGVYTTLGPSKSTSLSFRISDLEYARLVLEDPSVKGMKIPLYVYVLADGGLNAEPFVFDVQY